MLNIGSAIQNRLVSRSTSARANSGIRQEAFRFVGSHLRVPRPSVVYIPHVHCIGVWFSTHEWVAIWLEGIALVAIFIWDRLDSRAQHEQMLAQSSDCPCRLLYLTPRITPTPIILRSRSGYFERAFSASCRVLSGFDKGVNSPATYLNKSHCSIVFGISEVWHRPETHQRPLAWLHRQVPAVGFYLCSRPSLKHYQSRLTTTTESPYPLRSLYPLQHR